MTLGKNIQNKIFFALRNGMHGSLKTEIINRGGFDLFEELRQGAGTEDSFWTWQEVYDVIDAMFAHQALVHNRAYE